MTEVTSTKMYLFILIACGILSVTRGLIVHLTKPDDTVDLTDVMGHVTLLEQTFQIKTKELESEIQSTKIALQETKSELQVTKKELEDLRQNISVVEKTSQGNSQSLAQLSQTIALRTQDVSFNVDLLRPVNWVPKGARPIVAFDNVKYNTGSYNTTTGKFTAPVSGTYIFSAQVDIYGDNSQSGDIWILRSDYVIGRGRSDKPKDMNVLSISATTVTHMKQGEQVWVTSSTNDNINYGSGVTYFVGALLSSDHLPAV